MTVHLRRPHERQEAFIRSPAKRKVVRAGRRGGKTVGVAILAVERFLAGVRVLYAAPTVEQIDTFWREVRLALAEPLRAGVFRKNETEHYIERAGTENRLKAKTAYNADTMRGDYADLLILDEWQLCNEDAWEVVGAPMLLDNDGDAVFIYTPPSLRASGISRAHDPLHAAKLYRHATQDTTGRWATFHFTSHDNPHISQDALAELIRDMSRASYRQEIEAEDEERSPNQLIYSAFNEATCKIPPIPLPDSWPRYVGHDFGGANPAALFLAQDTSTGYFYAYREYRPGRGLSTAQHVEAFKEIAAGLNVLKRAGGSHQEGEIRQGYAAHGWPIQEPQLRRVGAQIDRVRGLMELNKLFVFDTLPHLLEELMTYLWKLDSEGKITDEIHNKSAFHLLDCLRGVLSDFAPETVQRSTGPMVYSV